MEINIKMDSEDNSYIFKNEDEFKLFLYGILTNSDDELGINDMCNHDKKVFKKLFIAMYKNIMDGIKKDPRRKGQEIKIEMDF